MYWYYKYPLIILLLVSAAGLTVFTWRRFNPPAAETAAAPGTPPPAAAAAPAPAGRDAGTPGRTDAPAPDGRSPAQIPAPVPAEGPADGGADAAGAGLPTFARLQAAAEAQYENGFLEAARALAGRALETEGVVEFDRNWFQAAELVNLVNQRLMNSSAPASEKRRYTIQAGDSLRRIARRHYTSVEAILRLNPSVDRETLLIHPRQVLSLLPCGWRIRVSKSRFVLILYNDGRLYRLYHVGIGREDRTPAGTFVVVSRLAHPAWTPPGRNIPYGDPGNILGTHWLGLHPFGDTDPTLSGYGIHGTWDPESIGAGVSAGCIRMRNEEVEELFDFMPEPGGKAPPVQVTIEE